LRAARALQTELEGELVVPSEAAPVDQGTPAEPAGDAEAR
jgi:hypothetical protein